MGRKERTPLEFESGKEKKKHKEKRKEKAKKDELERNSSVLEVCGDKMGKEVEGLEYDKTGGNHMNSGEEANKKKKRRREKEGDDMVIDMINKKELINDGEKSVGKTVEKVDSTGSVKKAQKILEDGKVGVATEYGDVAQINNKGGNKKKKEKKGKREKAGGELVQNVTSDGMEAGVASKRLDGHIVAENMGTGSSETCIRNIEAVDVDGGKTRKKKAKAETLVNGEDSSRNVEVVNVEDGKKRKKAKSEKHVVEDCNRKSEAVNVGNSKKRKKSKSEKRGIAEVCNEDKKKARSSKGSLMVQKSIEAPDNSEKSTPKKASKRVSFADDVEVFSPFDGPNDEHEDLVRGKRFSEEEDKIVKEAVLRYIEEHALGDDGLNMVLRCKSHPEVKNHQELKNCWKDIGAALPWRPFKSVYYRAHILFERAEKRIWTPEEYEEVKKFHQDRGADWRTLGDKLGKHRIHVKDAWRRIKLPNQKKGRWSQEEYETLFDLVNMDLRMKVFEEKKTKHGMLRDNICWEAISETLGTRTNAVCSMKWYNQLTSPLVSQKLWADIDDYRLLDALNSLDACCIEDVDWDDLLEHRPGDVCQKRWHQMVKHIGHHGLKSFPEQVEVLSKRYLADLIEAREIYASKPAVD
ncbi:DNA-binding protein REB1-like [Rosa rugosa]|uniref:DNA-binding protein REB1-like n=1 Tax=Rosa rugosa TaxID=74645 RepID=UPI002B418041|nr:DNA-binding protein REB1-like [Rosa rugosa]XP_062015994.1 DNA-binding protein REB1-like [Rosa rugosa]